MSNVNFNFDGKVVLVTGGASGIGFEITTSFLEAGSTVVVWDYSNNAILSAQKELSKFSNQVSFFQVDITQRNSILSAVESLGKSIDILVNNAGITRDKSFAKMNDADWDAVIQTNLTGMYNVTKILFDKFNGSSEQKRIINISSVVGIYGNFGQANYAAAKAGVIGFTKTLAKELGRKGFTANAIAPGFIKTIMTNAIPKDVSDAMAAKVPVQRLGEVDDIAHACLFLSSNQASYINGAVLNIDGGLVL